MNNVVITTLQKKAAIIGLLLSALLLYLALRNVDLQSFVSELSAADYRFVFPIFLGFTVFYVLKVFRWRVLLSSPQESSFQCYLYPLMTGFAANNVFPFRAGELIRVYLAGTTLQLPRARILGSIVAERLFDMLAVGLIVLLALAYVYLTNQSPEIGTTLIYTMVIATAVAIGLLCLMAVLAVRYRGHLERLLTRWLPDSINKQVLFFLSGFEYNQGFGGMVSIVFNSLLQWLMLVLCLMWSLEAVGINWIESVAGVAAGTDQFGNRLELVAVAAITMGVMILGISIPSTVAFVGTIEYAFVLSLGLFGVSADLALAAAVFYHLISFSLITLAGLICYLLYRLRYKRQSEIYSGG